MSGAEVEAQAKVNLRLHVLAREASGFHQIETLFLRLALSDTIRVRRTTGSRSIDITGLTDASAIGPADRNLAWRAAEAYLAAARWTGGFAIELEKRIPIGGGLGGGSADAGAVLRGLDALASSPLGETHLLRIAASLGADVPFLASEHPFALGWGRGERLLALPAPPVRAVALLVPGFSVNTAVAYGWLAETRAMTGAPPAAELLDIGALGDWRSLAAAAANDFEPVVAAHRPEISALVAALRGAGCAPAMMSGSGSVVFGVLDADAEMVLPTLPAGTRTLMTTTAIRVEPVKPLD